MNRKLSIEQLENSKWGEPEADTHLVKECHRLRRIPIENLSIGNLRVLIGQKIGLQFIIPLAIEILKENPFAEGDFYKGDLLKSVSTVDDTFWNKNYEMKFELSEIQDEIEQIFETYKEQIESNMRRIND